MNHSASQTHIDDLICAERGTGIVSWHGMNMLVISYETTDGDADADPSLLRRQTTDKPPDPMPADAAPPPSTTPEDGPVSRDAVLDALRRLSADKIGRRRHTGGGRHEGRIP